MTSRSLVNISNIFFTLAQEFIYLFTTVQFRSATQIDINNELSNVHNWLTVNKLSLSVKKTKYVLFHAINKPRDLFRS